MKLQRILLAILLALLGRGGSAQVYAQNAVGLLNVQGVLHENGQPINGFMDFCWGIFNVASGGTRLATDTNMNNNVLVSNGVANVTLNVGNLAALHLSPTQELYLELDLRRSGTSNAFTVLSPRQRIVPSMFATSAVHAEEARRLIEPLSADLLPPSVPRLDGSPTFSGTITTAGDLAGARLEVGAGHVLTGVGASILGGMNNTNLAAQSLIGGGEGNTIQKYASHSAILAGAQNSIGRAATNQSASPLLKALASIGTGSDYCIIAGGKLNGIGDYADYCSIVGGYDSDIGDYATYAFIGGGGFNSIASYAVVSTIGGGFGNSIGNDAWNSTVAGGIQNAIGDSSRGSSIGGGAENEIDISASNSTIAGGLQNQIRDSTVGGTIGGGVSNKVDQAAIFSTVSGGYSNVVGRPASVIGGGQYNFIAGRIATIGGGLANQIQYEAKASVIGGGASNIVENAVTNGTIAGGLGNTIHSNANFSAIGGGRENHIASTAPCAAIPGGREGRAISYGQIAHASGGFAGNQGTAQESFYVLRGTTVDNAQTELFLDGTGERVHVPASSTWTYDVLVTARDSGATPAGFHIRGMMGYNAAGILVAFGAPIITQLAGAPAITAQVLPDNVNKALTVKVTWGLANPLVARWVATVRTAEVAFPQ